MSKTTFVGRILLSGLAALIIAGSLFSTGCAVSTSGMTLPNPYYLNNRVQFFPAGPESPFPKEVSQLQEMQADAP